MTTSKGQMSERSLYGWLGLSFLMDSNHETISALRVDLYEPATRTASRPNIRSLP